MARPGKCESTDSNKNNSNDNKDGNNIVTIRVKRLTAQLLFLRRPVKDGLSHQQWICHGTLQKDCPPPKKK